MNTPDLELPRTRLEASRRGLLFRTLEMVQWLREDREVPEELGAAFLGSWVGLLRQDVLRRSHAREFFFLGGREGLLTMRLGDWLAPVEWDAPRVYAQFAEELRLPAEHVRLLLAALRQKLDDLGREGKAFEPVGWVIPPDALTPHRGEPSSFLVHFWSDFLNPEVRVPRSLVGDLRREREHEDAYAKDTNRARWH